jgi:hypothetical protein
VSGRTSIAHLLGRDLTIGLGGRDIPLHVVDWEALTAASDALAARAAALSADGRDDLYNREPDRANEIYEYFLPDGEDEVMHGHWLPFGLLGLEPGADSYAEENNEGILMLDLREFDGDRSPVVWLRGDGDHVRIADRVADLPVTPA